MIPSPINGRDDFRQNWSTESFYVTKATQLQIGRCHQLSWRVWMRVVLRQILKVTLTLGRRDQTGSCLRMKGNLALSDDATKSGELKRQFKQVTLELKNPELSKEDRETLPSSKQSCSCLMPTLRLACSTNIIKLWCIEIFWLFLELIRDPGQLSEAQVRSIFDDRIRAWVNLPADLGLSWRRWILVPELVGEFPQLRDNCDRLNDRFITFLGRDNQLEAKSDQSARELNRFVVELQETHFAQKNPKIRKLWVTVRG